MDTSRKHQNVAAIVATLALPTQVTLRAWTEGDFPAVQGLSAAEGWTTLAARPQQALLAWQHSWPVLVALYQETVIGFSRALSDGLVTTYVAELLVAAGWRRQGIATALLQTTHRLCPGSRLDLLATDESRIFYERLSFRPFIGFRWSWQEESARGCE